MGVYTYNIPVAMLESCRGEGRRYILRVRDLKELRIALQSCQPEQVDYIQFSRWPDRMEELIRLREDVPIDLSMPDPTTDFPKIYQLTDLAVRRPVRVSVTVTTGFYKAAALAASLDVAVKLVVTQPDGGLVGEMLDVLDLYLHRAGVTQPIEFYHSLLSAFYGDTPTHIWAIQEEDPALTRYVNDEGAIAISARRPETLAPDHTATFVDDLEHKLCEQNAECAICPFVGACRGYFKWPDPAYRCDGVKILLDSIQRAAGELRREVSTLDPQSAGEQS